jgi:hypothetical protein
MKIEIEYEGSYLGATGGARPDFKRRLNVEPALSELHSELAEL